MKGNKLRLPYISVFPAKCGNAATKFVRIFINLVFCDAVVRKSGVMLSPKPEHGGETRSHALRGNAV